MLDDAKAAGQQILDGAGAPFRKFARSLAIIKPIVIAILAMQALTLLTTIALVALMLNR